MNKRFYPVILGSLFLFACAEAPNTHVSRHQIDDLRDQDTDGVINQRDKCRDTPAGTLIDNVGCAVWLNEQSYAIDNILFDLDKSNIRPEQQAKITSFVAVLKDNQQLQLTLIGDTSSEGSETYNHALAKQRTDTIIKALVTQGIDSERVAVQEYYQDTNYTAQLKQRKRRVIAVFAEQQLAPQTFWTIYSSERNTLNPKQEAQ
ncbi:OmpA family protein [Agarivorans sp. MS3-6]